MRRFLFGSAIMFATLAPQVAPTMRVACAAETARAEDQQIAQDIVQILKRHKDQGQLRGFELDLQVENGVVWLKGHVSTAEQQQLVLDAAKQVKGVAKVVNRLELKSVTKGVEATASRPAEAQPEAKKSMFTGFTGKVKNAFQRSESEEPAPAPAPTAVAAPAAGSSRRTAQAEEAMFSSRPAQPVALAQAPAADAAPIAASQASAFAAPVSDGPGPSDGELAQRIVAKFNRQRASGALQGFDVDLRVDQGTVWLSGRVTSPQQRNLVLDIARREQGVVQVVNDLTVVGAQPIAQTAGAMPLAPAAQAAPAPINGRPLAFAPAAYHNVANTNTAAMGGGPIGGPMGGVAPIPASHPGAYGVPVRYDHPQMPAYAYPSYGAYPNYAGVTYPRQYSPSTWPYIGPFYPYPQVPLGWRRVTLEWDDGWWFLDFKNKYD